MTTSEAAAKDVLWAPNPGRQAFFYTHPANIVGFGGAAGGGKLLRVDEPIATPSGWTTMGALRVGDIIFDADGKQTRVIACSDIEPNPEAWRLSFDDGTSVECDGGHQWMTLTSDDRARITRADPEWMRKRREKRPSRALGRQGEYKTARVSEMNSSRRGLTAHIPPERGTAKTTRGIASTLLKNGRRVNHSILNPSAISLPDAMLPVDPYVLGAWLGDGTSKSGDITGLDEEVFRSVEAAGYVVTVRPSDKKTRGVRGLVTQLKALGVFGSKHIPQQYLRASIAQRVALMQGLCDTDGYSDPKKGCIEFTTTSRALRDGMQELLASLGIKAGIGEGRATLYGRDISAKWRITFYTSFAAFRIARKIKSQKRTRFRGTSECRYVTGARMVPPSPMRCISVDSPSRTYLAGRFMIPTHNSDAMLFHHFYVLDFESQRWMRSEITQSRARGIYFRRLATNLSEAEDRFLSVAPQADPRGMDGWNASTHTYKYSCGLKYRFAGMEKSRDYMKFQSFSFTDVSMDELTENEEEQFDYLFTRIRSADAALRPFFRLSWGTNPIGPGLEWVRKRFIAGRKSDVTYVRKIKNEDGSIHEISEVFIQAYLKDNPYLAKGGEYEALLRSSKPHIANILLHGDWWAQKGNFLGAFWDNRVHVVKDHKVPKGVFRFRSCDFGIGAYSSITWWYVDADGCFTAYHHLYLHDLTAPQQADRMREVEEHYGDWNHDDKMSMLNGPLDAQCFKRHGASGPTIAEDFRRKGFPWRPSAKDRFNGLAEVCKRLGARIPAPAHENVISTSAAKGMIRWMERCKAPIEYLPIIPADENNPGEVMKKYRHLHALDDTMFACMTRPIRPSREEDDWDDEEDVKSAWRRKDMRRIASIM